MHYIIISMHYSIAPVPLGRYVLKWLSSCHCEVRRNLNKATKSNNLKF